MKRRSKIIGLFALFLSIFALSSLANEKMGSIKSARADGEWTTTNIKITPKYSLVMTNGTDGFLYFNFSSNDYGTMEGGDYATASSTPYYNVSDYNFLTHVEISSDDVTYSPVSSFYDENRDYFFKDGTFRIGLKRDAASIQNFGDGALCFVKVLAGCEFPSYDYCKNGGTKKKYVQESEVLGFANVGDGGNHYSVFYNEVIITPKTPVTFSGISPYWNNVHMGNNQGYNQLILAFGTTGVDFLANDHVANTTNRATKAYDVGRKLTINGLPIYKFYNRYPLTKVGYDHGKNYLYVQYPVEALLSTTEYAVPTLHIPAGTEFMDSSLSEVTIQLAGGVWMVTDSNQFTIEDPYYFNTKLVVPFPYHFTTESHAIMGGLPMMGCGLAFNINTGDIDLSQNPAFHLSGLYHCRIIILPKTGTIQLFDVDGSSVVQTYNGFVFTPNTEYNFEIEFVCGEQTTVKFAINHYLLINHTFNDDRSGNCDFWILEQSGSMIMDFYEEVNKYKPVIDFGGSSVYDFIEGDPLYNFTGVVNAFDLYNDSISAANLVYEYEDGAVTNGHYNAGTWKLKIKLSVPGHKTVVKEITINVHGTTSVANVYYDDGEAIQVPVGAKLTPPKNPATYRENGHDYVFEGWYYQGAKWDFENNVVQGDMHLYSRFVETTAHYVVTVNFEGLFKPTETYSVISGGSLPFDLFEVDGASFEVYFSDNKINSLVVTNDTTIVVKYTVVFTYYPPVEPTESSDGHVGYWASPLYEGYYFADSEGKEVITDIRIPKISNGIDDDPLVANGNYKLFTISDYPFNVNDAGGWPWFSATEMVDAMSDSFGFRFILNIPENGLSSNIILRFGGTNLFGADAIITVNMNYSSNISVLFNGVEEDSSKVYPNWSTGVDHLVEIYFIKTSSASANILFGYDGELLWKSANKNISGVTFHNNFTAMSTANTASYYKSAEDTTHKALNRFSARQLHTGDIAFDNNSDTGMCLGQNGYYAKAKAFYNNFLTSNQKKAFASNNTYAQQRERMIAWGLANGETLSFNGSTGDLILNTLKISIFNEYMGDKLTIFIIIATCSASFLLAFVFLSKKKKNN